MVFSEVRFNEIGWILADADGDKVCFPADEGNPLYQEIQSQGVTPAPHVEPPPTYIEQRRPEYREKLATLKGEPGMDEVGVIGFQLDAIFAQLVTLAGGVGNMTPEMQGIITEVQAVKAKFPKP